MDRWVAGRSYSPASGSALFRSPCKLNSSASGKVGLDDVNSSISASAEAVSKAFQQAPGPGRSETGSGQTAPRAGQGAEEAG